MRTNWSLLALLVCSLAASAATKARKPRPVKDIRDLGNRELAIDIVLPVRLPTGNRTTTVNYTDLNARAATYACGTKVWTILGQVEERRIGNGHGGVTLKWTLKVRCDVAPAPAPPMPKPDGLSNWDYRFELQTDGGKVSGESGGIVEKFGARNEMRLYANNRQMFPTRFSSDGKRVDAQVSSPPGVTPASWTLSGPLTRSGRGDCDWKARVEDDQGNWLELVQPGGACR